MLDELQANAGGLIASPGTGGASEPGPDLDRRRSALQLDRHGDPRTDAEHADRRHEDAAGTEFFATPVHKALPS